MKSILVSWIGRTDLDAPRETEQVGLGPIAQAVEAREYDKIALISDYSEREVSVYLNWLRPRTNTEISVHYRKLSSPMHFGEIYEAAVEIVTQIAKEHGENANITFHLSPGASAMAAVWILLAKTIFPAELIQSSKGHGVETVSSRKTLKFTELIESHSGILSREVSGSTSNPIASGKMS